MLLFLFSLWNSFIGEIDTSRKVPQRCWNVNNVIKMYAFIKDYT